MKWILIAKGEVGCDYAIGCGVKVVEVEADNEAQAWRAAVEAMGWDDYASGAADMSRNENAPKSAVLYCVGIERDVMPLIHAWSENGAKSEAERARAKAAAEIERLKKLHGL